MNTLIIYRSSNTVYIDTGSYSKECSLSKFETKNNLYIVTCKLSNNINIVLTLPVQITTLIEIGGSGSGLGGGSGSGSGGAFGDITDDTNNDSGSGGGLDSGLGDNEWEIGGGSLKD